MEDYHKNQKSVLRAWLLYYWANSVYPLVILTALFPIYYSRSTEAAFGSEVVNFLGFEVVNTVIYNYSLSFAYLMITLLTPILSGLADYSGLKKHFLIFFTLVGTIASSSLFFFEGHNLLFGLSFFVIAAIGFSGSHIFYNAYLPQIATPDKFDRLSAQGFSMGYIGSALMLIICIVVITTPQTFGIPGEDLATRIAFFMVGIWWLGFGSISFFYLPHADHRNRVQAATFTHGFRELKTVFSELKGLIDLQKFMGAFFLFSTGLQTIIIVATLFAEREIDMEQGLLIGTILIIQFVAVGGAYLTSILSHKKGNIFALITCLIIWSAICVAAFFVHTATTFMILAAFVGLVLGGTQAIARSTFSKLLPERKDHNTFFNFYEILENIARSVGTFSFALLETLTGSMRYSAVLLALFFIAGMFLLSLIKDRRL